MIDLSKFIKKAQEMEQQMSRKQTKFNNKEFSLTKKNGMLKITMMGSLNIKSIYISPDLIKNEKSVDISSLLLDSMNELIKKINTARKKEYGQYSALDV